MKILFPFILILISVSVYSQNELANTDINTLGNQSPRVYSNNINLPVPQVNFAFNKSKVQQAVLPQQQASVPVKVNNNQQPAVHSASRAGGSASSASTAHGVLKIIHHYKTDIKSAGISSFKTHTKGPHYKKKNRIKKCPSF